MTLLTIINSEREAKALAKWGIHFATSQRLSPKFLILEHGRQESDCDIDLTGDIESPFIRSIHESIKETIRQYKPYFSKRDESDEFLNSFSIRAIVTPERKKVSLNIIKELNPNLLLVGKQESAKEANEEAVIAKDLFEIVSCATILLRIGDSDGVEAEKILLPVAGGPHALFGLDLCSELATINKGTLTALHITSPRGPLSKTLGERTLLKELGKVGLEPSENIESRVVVSSKPRKEISDISTEGFDLILLGASNSNALKQLLFGTIPKKILSGKDAAAIGVIRAKKPVATRLRETIERWLDLRVPQLNREDRVKLFEDLELRSKWGFDFMVLMSLSTAIAGLGLIQNSAAVVIGAMLVAPLMIPLLGGGLSLVQENTPLLKNSTKSILYGFLSALCISILLGFIAGKEELSAELLARGGPTLLDLLIAFLSGIAGAHCTARPTLSAALPGVAIAAALVPPIATTGISLATGFLDNAQGAAMLFTTNVVAIILGAAFTFYSSGVRGAVEKKSSKRWADRAVIGLLFATVALAIPLSTVLISTVQDTSIEIPPELRTRLEKIVKLETGGTISSINAQKRSENILLELKVRASGFPGPELIQKLVEEGKRTLSQPVSIKVFPNIVLTGNSEEEEK